MEIVCLADHRRWAKTLAHWHVGAWQPLYPGWDVEAAFRELCSHGGCNAIPMTLLALEEGVCLGSVSLLQEDAREFLPLFSLVGKSLCGREGAGRGIGRRLVRRAEAEARRIGVSVLYLFTEDREDFYLSLGWRRLRPDRLAERAVVILEKIL